ALSDPPLVGAMLVATSSPGFDPGWPADVSVARALAPLPTSEVLKALANTVRPSSSLLSSPRTINPLYVEQLLRFLREESGAVPPGPPRPPPPRGARPCPPGLAASSRPRPCGATTPTTRSCHGCSSTKRS